MICIYNSTMIEAGIPRWPRFIRTACSTCFVVRYSPFFDRYASIYRKLLRANRLNVANVGNLRASGMMRTKYLKLYVQYFLQ